MTKKILAVLVVLLLAGTVGLVVGCGGNLPKDAVAKVGSVIITQKTFDAKVADFEVQYAGQIPDKTTDAANYKLFQQDVLEYMVTYELAAQAAKGWQLTVTDADVQKSIDEILQQSFGGDQAQFDAALASQGLTLELLKKGARESLLLQKVYDKVTADITTVPDAEIQTYYDANQANYLVAETRAARHILLTPATGRVDATTSTTTTSSTTSTTVSTTGTSDDTATTASSTPTASSSTTTTAAPTQADWDSALEAAKLVRTQLMAGADWTAEAALYSDDPGSRSTGGDLGTFSKGEMVQEFDEAVFSAKLNDISEPVKTAYGYHIIQVTAINEAKQHGLDEVKDGIKSSLLVEKKSEAWKKWMDEQKVKLNVVYATAWTPSTTTTSAATPTTTAPSSSDTTAAAPAETTTSVK